MCVYAKGSKALKATFNSLKCTSCLCLAFCGLVSSQDTCTIKYTDDYVISDIPYVIALWV